MGKKIQIIISDSEYEFLKQYAKERDITINEAAREIFHNQLDSDMEHFGNS